VLSGKFENNLSGAIRFLLAAPILTLGLAFAPVRAAAVPAEELKALRSKLEALKQDIARGEDSRSEAADSLKSSEQAISEANRRLLELGAAKAELDAHLTELGERRRALESRLAQQQRLASRLIYQQYTTKPAGPFELLANGQDPNAVARSVVYFSYIALARKSILDGLSMDRAALQALAEESAQRLKELAVIHHEQAAEATRLESERNNRKQVLAKISTQIERQRREAGALEGDARRLTKLVEDLAKLLAARKPPAKKPTNERAPEPRAEGTAFQQLKGRLHPPVRGELVGRFGSPRSDSGLSWRGLFIKAPAGREVRAVAAGRIVFADWLRGFGNLLILDHGDGFMSLYGNNESLIGRIGDLVRGGDTVATVGSSGGNTATGLYFELRHQGKAFDPSSWVNFK
jgi:murein hydrolase activator